MNRPRPTQMHELLAHADWLRELAAHVIRGEEAADLAQDTWVAALRSPPDPARPSQPWLAAVLRNFARRRHRDERNRQERAHAGTNPATVPSPQALLERAEAQRLLAELVVGLPEPYRATVLLRYYEGMTAAAIARAQGIPPGTVRWRLKQALDRLRLELDARHGGRSAWTAVLLPLAPPRPEISPLKGALLMVAKTKSLALIAVLLLLVGGAVLWRVSSSDQAGLRPRATAASRTATPRARRLIEAWQRAEDGRPGVIEGLVRDADGKPAVGARVALVVSAAYEDMEDKTALRPRAIAVSGTDGRFRFEQVAPGVYLLTATATGWLPAERADLSLLPGETPAAIELRLGRGGVHLTGLVSDAGGGPIAEATLRALALGAGGRPEGARTFVAAAGVDGRYDLSLPRGHYRVVADANGYAPAGVKLPLDVDRTQNFRLSPAARISGRVVDPNGAAVALAQVRIESEAAVMGPSRAALSRTTLSDPAGSFLFSDLLPGTYRASARTSQLQGRTERRIVLGPGGAATDLVIELGRGHSVSGTVTDAGGQPVASARIRAGTDLAVATSGRDGRYRVEGLPPGKHTLSAQAPGCAPAQATASVDNADVTGLDLVLQAESRVDGRVLARNGSPLAGASVTALVSTADALSDRLASAAVGRTDEQGRFSLGGLSAGELRVDAEHPDQGRGLAGPLPLAAGERRAVEIRIGHGGLLRGTVLWEDRRPAAGAVVTGRQRQLQRSSTVADAQGRYELGPFSPGELVVEAAPETDPLEKGGNPTERRLTLTPGQDQEGVDFVLARRDEEIAGTVLAPDGTPLAGATLGIARPYRGISYRPYNKYAGEADAADYTVLSGPDGAFVLKFLPKGTFDVWATHPEFPEADTYTVATGSRGVSVQFVRGATLAGRALDAAERPIAAFTIAAMLSQTNDASPPVKAARGYVQSTFNVQDVTGAFEVTGLHPARYDLLVTTPDGRGGRIEDIALGTGESRRGLRVVVGDTIRMKGRIVDEATRAPISGVTVVASLAMFVTDVSGRSGADGTFALDGIVPGGAVTLSLRGDGRSHGARFVPVTIPASAREFDAGSLTLGPPRRLMVAPN